MPFPRMHKLFSAALACGVAAGIGTATALWTSDAVGGADAVARTSVHITVQGDSGAADLYPGASHGDVSFTVDNPNPYPVRFTGLTVGMVTSSDEVACPSHQVTLHGATGLEIDVPAGAVGHPATVDAVVAMSRAAPDGCQGASFAIELTLTGEQV